MDFVAKRGTPEAQTDFFAAVDIAAARYASRLALDPEAPAFELPADDLRDFEMTSFIDSPPLPVVAAYWQLIETKLKIWHGFAPKLNYKLDLDEFIARDQAWSNRICRRDRFH